MKTIKQQPAECSVKKGVLKNFKNFTGKHLCPQAFNFIKKKLYCEVFKNIYFEEHKRTAGSLDNFGYPIKFS